MGVVVTGFLDILYGFPGFVVEILVGSGQWWHGGGVVVTRFLVIFYGFVEFVARFVGFMVRILVGSGQGVGWW